MYSKRSVAPLTIDTRSHPDKTGLVTTATFHYTEQPSTPQARRRGSINRPGSRQATREKVTSPRKQVSNPQMASIINYQNTIQPPVTYVRALYDYDADDRTSLSFKQGDIIQVSTQLESGWWDGIINDVRGWFPSNYCAVVPSPSEFDPGLATQSGDEQSAESGTEDEYEDSRMRTLSIVPEQAISPGFSGFQNHEEEAAFWIPQATQDGRLFYYNTLTGVSTMDLPLETPTQANENGPKDRMTVRAPKQTRPPPELMAGGGVEREEDDASASEYEGDSLKQSRGSLPRKRRSQISDGFSPSASMESLNASPVARNRKDSKGTNRSRQDSAAGTVAPYPGVLLGQYSNAIAPTSFYDDGAAQSVTWNRLVENIRKSVESYRQAINNADRGEYVRKAEDISDHLRMILAAGSGTTDNHSGNPSVISTNKQLYPHFRDMMSRFSKLVLSSHMASADWPAPDSYAKCLQEAEGVLQGVYGYVDVARKQRGEEISRLVPGFVLGASTGGSWLNNNISTREQQPPVDRDVPEPSAKLDSALLERMDDLKRMVVSSIRRLEEHLVVQEKIVNHARHELISNSVSTAAVTVIDYCRPYLATLESINLSQIGHPQSSQIQDLISQKQRLYDLVGSLVITCQTVGGPLSDEWAEIRGDPLATRMQEVQNTTRQLEASMSQLGLLLQQLLQISTTENAMKLGNRAMEGDLKFAGTHSRNISKGLQRPQLGDLSQSQSFSDLEPGDIYQNNPKVKKFFGEVPTAQTAREPDEVPWFLKLEHEDEIAVDMKVDPPQLRGGTLIALVEQLTRHDRLDTSFNNTFLLTYRSFTTAAELFEMLVRRFSIQPPRGISQDEYRTWAEKKQKPIRFRVVNILKIWLDTFWMENNDEVSDDLLTRIHAFAKDSIATSSTPGSAPLIHTIEQRIRGQDKPKKLILNLSTAAPAPIIPKNMKKLKFLDIDVTEFARQLTIIESNLYGKIKPTECLNKTWQKKVGPDEPDLAPNVKALIWQSNQLTNWVAEMILTQSDVKKRVVVIKHFVSVADVSPSYP